MSGKFVHKLTSVYFVRALSRRLTDLVRFATDNVMHIYTDTDVCEFYVERNVAAQNISPSS